MKTEIPELHELLDERDKLRREPMSDCTLRDLGVIEFQIKIRRGTTGNMVMNGWQRDMLHYFLTLGINNETK
jgi:hypothetical protein